MSKLTYEEACAAMQAGVGAKMNINASETNGKHLRVGVNSAMVDTSALVRLLIAKGIFTDAEWSEALTAQMNDEVKLYEQELTRLQGVPVTLGYDKSERRGFVQYSIDNPPPTCGAPTSSSRFAPCTLPRGHEGKQHVNERIENQRKAASEKLAADFRAEVDRSQRTTLHGTPEGEHRDIDPETGMQKDYVVLTTEERSKGFVRHVRRSYKHEKCGTVTTMGQALAETYARDPTFYDGTFCCGCKKHLPVGPEGEFVWVDDGTKVGT